MFQALFPAYQFDAINVYLGEFPENVDKYEVYMATGSAHSVYEDLPWIQQIKAFIKEIHNNNKYFIGFCFGHQLVAQALGGKVAKASNGWCVGVHEFTMHHTKNWMLPFKEKVNFLLMCQDQVVELPNNAICLAGNQACPNAIMQVGERILSIQGHPEFSKAINQALMKGRIELIGAEKVQEGIDSLELSLDTLLFQKWVNNFLSPIKDTASAA